MDEELVYFLNRRILEAEKLDTSGFVGGTEYYDGQIDAFGEIIRYLCEKEENKTQ